MSPPADPHPSAGEALSALGPAWVERFRVDVLTLAGEPFDEMLALAVSGGPDSMAMLALAAAAFPGRVIAATVDHRLRPEAADEAAMVAQCCAVMAVPHRTLKPDTAPSGASIQAAARQARYALLGEWAFDAGAAALLTAHHCDDQAETFLMRARRGSGPGGLAGIRPRWEWERHRWQKGYPKGGVVALADVDTLPVLRPLLGWRRQELREVAVRAGIRFANDPSNVDDRFDRVRMRALLDANPLLDAAGLAHSAAICGEIDRDLTAMMEWLRHDRMREADADARCYDMAGLPRELRRRLARDAIGYVRDVCAIREGKWHEAANIEPLLDMLEAGKSATQAGVLVSARGEMWLFHEAPPRRSP